MGNACKPLKLDTSLTPTSSLASYLAFTYLVLANFQSIIHIFMFLIEQIFKNKNWIRSLLNFLNHPFVSPRINAYKVCMFWALPTSPALPSNLFPLWYVNEAFRCTNSPWSSRQPSHVGMLLILYCHRDFARVAAFACYFLFHPSPSFLNSYQLQIWAENSTLRRAFLIPHSKD